MQNYTSIQRSGIQGWGNSLVDRLVESKITREEDFSILELGASSGEHLTYVSRKPKWKEYVCLDLQPGKTNPTLYQEILTNKNGSFPRVRFVVADAQEIPFDDSTFDIVVATCLLAHVDRPDKVMQESRRVVKNNGQIIVGFPCDPGLINRLIKAIITFPKIRRQGIENPDLIYALDHRNSIHNLVILAKHVFRQDSTNISYFPFKVHSWNLNLVTLLNVRVNKVEEF
jgi:ubiquinone/menaquinone biosynthesis C-methylase UbiE